MHKILVKVWPCGFCELQVDEQTNTVITTLYTPPKGKVKCRCCLLQATGVELNPWLVIYSKIRSLKLRRTGLHGSTKFIVRDLWKHDLSCYNHIVIFGVDSMMPALHSKLMREMTVDSSVIACRFPLPCTPSQTVGEGLDTVWLYKYSDIMQHST